MTKQQEKQFEELKKLANEALKDREVCVAWRAKIYKAIGTPEGYSYLKMQENYWYLEYEHKCLIKYIGDNKVMGYFRHGDDIDIWNWENDKKNLLKCLTSDEVQQIRQEYNEAIKKYN